MPPNPPPVSPPAPPPSAPVPAQGVGPSLDTQLALAFGPAMPCAATFVLGGETVTLTLAQVARMPAIPLLTICVSGTVNEEPFHIYVGWAHIDACLEDLAPGLSAASLSASAKALIVEAALAGPLDELERALEARVEINFIDLLKDQTGPAAVPNLKFNIGWGAEPPRAAYAAFPPALERRLIKAWSGRVDGDADADPSLDVTVRVGCVALTQTELADLTVDDVLVLDDSPIYTKQCCLIIGERMAALGLINGNQLTLNEPLSLASGSWNAKYCLTGPAQAARAENGGQPPKLKIAVDLARQRIRLSQLLGIPLDKPIGLPKSLTNGVELFSGRKAIGFGHIVRVGDAIAVRLVKVNAHAS
jgi:type III secretion protein Q